MLRVSSSYCFCVWEKSISTTYRFVLPRNLQKDRRLDATVIRNLACHHILQWNIERHCSIAQLVWLCLVTFTHFLIILLLSSSLCYNGTHMMHLSSCVIIFIEKWIATTMTNICYVPSALAIFTDYRITCVCGHILSSTIYWFNILSETMLIIR